jgi:hypothetical protein
MTHRIQDDAEYRVTLSRISEFEAALARVREEEAQLHPIQARAMLAALSSQLEDLQEEAAAYEQE